ncbi:MAG: Na+:solute symporter, partial [Candidatus Krumholzibacteria bacterium]|nr:Na+:solute symporter [Candidatus Krumholzibacteria bacterium]
MSLAPSDIAVLAAYLAVVFGIGVAMSRRASRSTEEYFVSGRRLPWWIVGTSMVATTFAADTPLVVSGLVAQGGIFGNWMWWHWLFGAVLAVFLIAPLWNRAGVTTDAELIELRYDGRPARALRIYRAVWFGVLQNVLVIAWVMRAMAKIVITVMGWDGGATVLGMHAEVFTVLVLFALAVSYTVLSGLWGVVMTDVLQFVVAMAGSIYLAAAAWSRLGGLAGITAGLAGRGFDPEAVMRIVPRAQSILDANPFTEFLLLVLVVWWASYQVDGGGYLAQRLFAARDERHSVFGYLWFCIAHVCLRPWPWIAVGLCGMAYFGTVDDPETYYPLLMREILPPGLFGLVLASFVAAFMSTIDTQLHWGSSLVVNDLIRRFLWKGRSDRWYVASARISVAALAVIGALASFAVRDISFAWKLIISVTAGIGSVYIARWYWWRVNAWSEITAMAAAALCTGALALAAASPRWAGAPWTRFPYSTALTALVVVPAWVAATFLTRPVGTEHLARFYRTVRPG